ncbi:hypothetical protein ACHAWF_013678 [Thalassiosira exigua]
MNLKQLATYFLNVSDATLPSTSHEKKPSNLPRSQLTGLIMKLYQLPYISRGIDHEESGARGKADILGYAGFRFASNTTDIVKTKLGYGYYQTTGLDEGRVVDIFDARETPMTLERNGFTLISVDEDHYEPKNWNNRDQERKFQSDTSAKLKELFPDASRFQFIRRTIRGKRFGPPAALDFLHTDVYEDMDAIEKFYSRHGHTDGKRAILSCDE